MARISLFLNVCVNANSVQGYVIYVQNCLVNEISFYAIKF
jgi:hypothetical protein